MKLPDFFGPAGFPLAFGTWALGETDWGEFPARPAKDLLRHAWDLGFRHFDTAESYGAGRAEQLLGQAFRDILRTRREALHISSKSVIREAPALRKHLERSLRRLGTDYLDIFYIHWPREGMSLPAALEELRRLADNGLIRSVGVCNITDREYRLLLEHTPPDLVQEGYNLLWRKPEQTLWPHLRCPRVAYSPLAQGLLARSFPRTPTWDTRDHRQTTPFFRPPLWEALHRFNTSLIEACRDQDLLPGAVAIRWLLGGSSPRSDAAVVGGRNPRQLSLLARGLETISSHRGEARYLELEPKLEKLYQTVAPLIPDLPNIFGYTPTPRNSTLRE
ncbi:Predicted oxidoreductase [Alkalispirochaeta americana]|uniref:Predicted oxidoreductase n=1 Tax=Alkalispirochaeta americana TaxID=159291 RepID=A0A1N6TWV4_9SPIO|nr:aldo/keto reductase [Alkalispirochaeta americana]SIQ57855.1 Predicted oxidoreductase [Alkalispirochaeta americana]